MSISNHTSTINTTTVVAPTSRNALRLIREKLGPDAMVLSNRVIDGGVEIVAIADSAAALAPPAEHAQSIAEPVAQPTAPAAASVLDEIQAMRGMLEAQLGELVWSEKQKRDPVRGHLLRALLGSGFSARLAKAMLDHLPNGSSYGSGMEWVRAELARKLTVLDNEDAMMEQGGVYALVGPTGVGKTTTTAKLAARCVMRFGPEKLALLTTDSYRIGAYEQLRIYGQILGVPTYAVRDTAELRMVLGDLRDKHMVLIDTVGMSQRDRKVSEQVAMLCGAGRPVRRLLLLNAATHGDTLNEVVHAYRQGGEGSPASDLAGCIFTKMDEATHPGALIDMAIRHRLPVHYVSSGQKVPENLAPAERSQLVDSVFSAGSQSALFVPGEADLEQQPAPLQEKAEAEAEAAASRAVAGRLREQCQKLIRALAQDAQELSANATALATGEIGFEGTRASWRSLADDAVSPKAVTQSLLAQARADIEAGCDSRVLALTGKVRLGDVHAMHGSLLLSDRSGMPLAALNPQAGTADPALRQLEWLRRQDLGKPVLLMPAQMPAPELMHEWQAAGIQWLARGRAGMRVLDADGGELTLMKLAQKLSFSEAQPVMHKAGKALQSVAEARVTLSQRPAPVLRCVVIRIVEARSGNLLEQRYLLGHVDMQANARQIVQWHYWRLAAMPYFTLLRQGINQHGGCEEPGDFNTMRQLAILAQAGTTVWRLKHAQDRWAEPARNLLAQLSGRAVRPGKMAPASVLFEGLDKLFVLLDALDADSAATSVAPAPMMQGQGA